jgi:hypothetical protein
MSREGLRVRVRNDLLTLCQLTPSPSLQVRRGSARLGRIWDEEEARAVSLALEGFSTAAKAPDELSQPRASPLSTRSSNSQISAERQIQLPTRRKAQASYELSRPHASTSSSRSSVRAAAELKTQPPAWKNIFHKRASGFFSEIATRLSRGKATSTPQDIEVGALNVRAVSLQLAPLLEGVIS